MSTTAGVFSETTLQNVRAMADEMMLDDRIKLQFQAQVAALNVIPSVQTARINQILNSKKDKVVEVEWINACALADQDCTSCEVGGTELSTNTKTYQITKCREVPFSVKGYQFIANDFDQQAVVAKGLLAADRILSEYVAQDFLDFLATNAGTNTWTLAGEIGNVVGNETQIAAANFDADAIAYLLKVYQFNRFVNAQTLSGNLLFDDWMNGKFNAGAATVDAGAVNRFSAMNMNWDIFNFNAAGYNDTMFGLSVGSIAAASKTYFGPGVVDYGKEGKRWSMQSNFVPWLNYDVHYNTNCEQDQIGEDFVVKARWDFFTQPEACDDGNNGILAFVAV